MANFNDPFSFGKSLLPSSVGFDSLFKQLEDVQKQIAKTAVNYPPYNIKKVEDNKYVIELAVAGFGKQDIEVTMQDGVLTVKGQTTLDTLTKDGIDVTYLHKGIADRAFTRQFSLADTIEIKNAELINGMLKLWLENIIPDTKKPRKIDIEDTVEKSYGNKVHDKQLLNELKK
jgi:molecular chaperone IbpA